MKILNALAVTALAMSFVTCRAGDIHCSAEEHPHEHKQNSEGHGDVHPDNKKTAAVINSKCPVMGGDVDLDASTATYKGLIIGFGSEDCIKDWNSYSNTEKDASLTMSLSRKKEGSAR